MSKVTVGIAMLAMGLCIGWGGAGMWAHTNDGSVAWTIYGAAPGSALALSGLAYMRWGRAVDL